MISGTLPEILASLAQTIESYPRRVPGELSLEGRPLRYADLRSFYYQCRQVFAERLYDFEPGAAPSRILDCGAHIGIASLFFASRFPGVAIEAFEADPVIAQMAAANLAAFGFNNVKVEAKAVWINNSEVLFSSSSDDAGFAGSGSNAVPAVRLRDLVLAAPVDLLKLDIEGGEFAVLADCENSLSQVKRIVVEVHQLRDEGQVGSLLSILERAGFRYTFTDLHSATWMPTGHAPPFSACKSDRYIFTVYAWRV
jgi:FkbM family methyltransferase